jgi:hypothetical protein
VPDVLGEHGRQVPFTGDQDPIGAFAADGTDPPFRDSVGAGRLRWGAEHLDASGGEYRVEDAGEFRVPVPDQEPQLVGAAVQVHQQVPRLLGHPCTGRVRGDPGEVHLPGGQFDEEQHVDPFQEHGVDGEEVTRHDRLGLGGEKLLPRRTGPARRRIHASLVEDLPDRAVRHTKPEPGQLAVDAAVAPGWVLRRQPQYQPARLPADGWPARSGVRIGPMSGDQLPMPPQERGWSDEERRPPRPGQEPGQRRKHHSVGRLQVRAVDLPAQHRDLVAQHEQLDVLRAAVAGELDQHLEDLPQQHVHQRRRHATDHRPGAIDPDGQPARQRPRREFTSGTARPSASARRPARSKYLRKTCDRIGAGEVGGKPL